jgi:hypothetical protein
MPITTVQDLLKSLGYKGQLSSKQQAWVDRTNEEAQQEAAGTLPPQEPTIIPGQLPFSKKLRSTQTAQTATMKAAKTKSQSAWAKLEASYKRYDPAKEGYGNADEWRGTFHARMGWEKAMKILGDATPRQVLGVSDSAPWAEIKSAYRAASLANHPDRLITTGADPIKAAEMWEKISAAYEVLEHEKEQEEKLRTKKAKKALV